MNIESNCHVLSYIVFFEGMNCVKNLFTFAKREAQLMKLKPYNIAGTR